MNNENDKPTGENERESHSSLFEKTINLREQTIRQAKNQNKKIEDVLVMDHKIDPFYIGSEGDIAKAKWAYNLYTTYVNETGIDSLHNRGLHYYTVMSKKKIPRPHPKCTWEYYENTKRCSNYLNDALDKARYLGYIPFDKIIDKKNRVTRITEYYTDKTEYADWIPSIEYNTYEGIITKPRIEFRYKSIDDFVETMAQEYANVKADNITIDHNVIKPFYIAVWSEKTLPEFIHKIFRNMGVNTVVEGGELSLRIMYDFIQRLNTNKQDGIALYFSDYDYKGKDMPLNMSDKIQWAKCVDMLEQKAYLQPIAITEHQIIENNLPLAPLEETGDKKKKGHDTLIRKFKAGQGIKGIAELQALEGKPELYKEIVRDAIQPWTISTREITNSIDNTKTDLKKEIETRTRIELEKQRDKLTKLFTEVMKLQSKVGTLLPKQAEIDKLDKQFEKAREILNKESNKDKFTETINDIWNKIELPDIETPHIKRDPSIKCLYDSRRDQGEQFKILYDRKITKRK